MVAQEKAHAKLSPSSAHRWLECPGSITFVDAKKLAEGNSSSEPAAHGTILHDIAETCLKDPSKSPWDYLGQTIAFDGFEFEITADDCRAVDEGLEFTDHLPGEMYVETRVKLDPYAPEQFGTLDLAFIDGDDIITIFDWKFGRIPVSPAWNEQLMLYALGFYEMVARHKSKATRFQLVIWQPFAPTGGGSWECSLEDMLTFGERVIEGAKRALDPAAPRIPGAKQCYWCEGAKYGVCPENKDWLISSAVADFEVIDEESVTARLDLPEAEWSPEEVDGFLRAFPLLTKLHDLLKARTAETFMAGGDTAGWKLVAGRRGNRAWANEEVAVFALKQRMENPWKEPKLLSPPEVEKALGIKIAKDDVLKKLVVQHEGKPTLAPPESTKPAVQIADFGDD